MAGPFSPPAGMYPALYLYPLNDTFVPKHISLAGGQKIKIGRQMPNAKTVPAEKNGFFDSKVLSRQHAMVWEEAGKIYIKDVKSSNGTFVNGERLSPEGQESDPFELKTDDIVEFGIDIVGEDNKTVVHHKVAARVICVFNESDAALAQRSETSSSMSQMNGFNFGGPNGSGGPRRPGLSPPQGLGGMGSFRPPGKSGLTFDHIISRLQGELQKSRETGADLHSLTGAMGDIHDTLGGQMPTQLPSFPAVLPPVRPPMPEIHGAGSSADSDAGASSSALGELQEQLRETQSSLAGHADKVRALESVLAEHDAIKREMADLRETLSVRPTQAKMALQAVFEQPELEEAHSQFDVESDDDDIRSVGTAVPHDFDSVEDEALASSSDEEEVHRVPRPRTPEPGSLGMGDEDQKSFKARSPRSSSDQFIDISLADHPSSSNEHVSDELSQRLAALAAQLETALELSRTLQQQQEQSQGTISALTEKVAVLEGRVQVTEDTVEQTAAVVEDIRSSPEPAGAGSETLTELMGEFKKHVEGQWSSVQEEWATERERLRRATEEWERRAGAIELSVSNVTSRVDTGLERVEDLARSQAVTAQAVNEVRHHGLATPPSPQSLADSPRSSRIRRRRASRSSSHSGKSSVSAGVDMHPALETSSSGSGSEGTSAPSSVAMSFIDSPRRAKMPWLSRSGIPNFDQDAPEQSTIKAEKADNSAPTIKDEPQEQVVPHKHEAGHDQLLTPISSFGEDAQARTAETASQAIKTHPDLHLAQYSSALGVVVLSVAAAAVMYRVKPDFAS